MMPDFWSRIEALPHSDTLADLFKRDPDRMEKLALDVAGIRFDWTKTHLDDESVSAFVELAEACDLPGARDRLFAGEPVNVTEERAVEHGAERGEGAAGSVVRARKNQARMHNLIQQIDRGELGNIRHILHVGIGGSALGPDLIVDALGRHQKRYDVAVVSNVDGAALEAVTHAFDPQATLLVVASKTFTTTETMLNAISALEWMADGAPALPFERVVALTAAPEKASAWGVDEARILPFSEAVGGRYSLWSTIGFPFALALGFDLYEELLAGAADMDRHFRSSELAANAPVLAAFADLYYTQVRACQTRATFAYDERLRLLPAYLQQLEMESNGKSVTIAGEPVFRDTAPVTWGGVGTDAQHAVFQLLHQGTRLVPVEFVAVVEPGHALDKAHHRQLLLNAFAQGAALMAGRDAEDLARAYSGDRPSSTLLLDRLDARSLGALIAFYEHRTFVNATLLGINAFDQFGVELGKEMAKAADKGDYHFDRSTMDLLRRAGFD